MVTHSVEIESQLMWNKVCSVLNKNQDCSSIKISIGIVSFHVETLKWLNCWLLRCVSSRVWRVWRRQTWHLNIPKFLFALRSSAEPLIRVWKSWGQLIIANWLEKTPFQIKFNNIDINKSSFVLLLSFLDFYGNIWINSLSPNLPTTEIVSVGKLGSWVGLKDKCRLGKDSDFPSII